MQVVLDALIYPYHIRRVRELINFVLVVGTIFLLGMFFLYHRAFFIEANNIWKQYADDHTETTTMHTMDTTVTHAAQSLTMDDMIAQQIKKDTMIASLSASPFAGVLEHMYEYDLQNYLAQKVEQYPLVFNTTIPGNRIIIPSLEVDAPIVDVKYASEKKLIDADFEEELKQGVVKYPFTAAPGQAGNALLFGHSSVDAREQKDNDYGFVFYQLPKLVAGDTITIVWKSKEYTYQVEEKTITLPEDVGDELQKYQHDKYLTLMACYPLFTDQKRILVRAVYIGEDPLPDDLPLQLADKADDLEQGTS